ncbi:MAG: 2Fe-2S iron-sulfur cluster-binding protein [Armatimonadaceae bacterium]
MPKLTVEGFDTYDVPEGKKLVLAIEDAGIDIMHRCGGYARCTTCRVEVVSGEVPPMSAEEMDALEEPELIEKYRLSCQLRVNSDMTVRLWKRASEEGVEPGDRPED